MYRKRRGAISLFLVIVIPVMILGGMILYDLLWIRYQDEKALKIVSAVSEAHLSRYNEYLKTEYRLIAGLDLGVLSESVDAYFSYNGYTVNTESSVLSLDDPENFKDIVVKSMIANISKSVFDELLGFDKWREKWSAKLKTIEEGMEGIADLIAIPAEIDKMTKTRDPVSLRAYIREMKSGISIGDVKFSDIEKEIREGLEDLADLSESVEKTLVDAEKKYEEVKADALEFAERVQSLIDEIDDGIKAADACFAEIERLEKYLKEEGLGEDEISRTEQKITDLEEEMERHDRIVQENKALLDRLLENKSTEVNKGAFYSIIRKIKKALKRLAAVLDLSVCDGGILNAADFSADGMTPLGMLEKMALVEWCVSVMSCYEKDASVEGRAVKGELEYIVSGKSSEHDSLSVTKNRIAELRLIPNMITFFRTDFKQELDAFLSVIPAPFHMIARMICYSGSVLLESQHDVSMLLEGGKIPILKNPKDWGLTLDSLVENKELKRSNLKEGFSYKDYIRVLLYLKDEKDVVVRAMQLVDASVEKASEGQFRLRDYTVGHIISVDYDISSMFRKRKSRIIYENAYD